MAVVFEGFSIRQYAAKMRSVDVVKCWPFGGGADEIINKEDIEPLLPPITVTKFRWWSHELDLLRSSNNSNSSSVENAGDKEDKNLVEEKEEKLDMVCPVCRVFTAATVNAVNAHIDSCLVQASREERRQMRLAIKAKSRPPKKRSIVDIFAESRQIDKVDVDDDNLDEEDGQRHELDFTNVEFNFKIEKKKKKKKKKMKKVKVVNKLMKKKKLKKKSSKNRLITNKENPNKLKLQTPVKFTRKLNDSVCKKGLSKDILDAVTIHRKKQDLRRLSPQKRHNVVQTTKLITEHQESVVTVRGILKNHKKDVPMQNTSISSVQGGSQVNPCGIQHSDRHVRFSGKDDILGPSKRSVSSFENNICKLYADTITSSSKKHRSTESEDELATLNGSDGDVVSTSIERGTGVQPMIEKDLFPRSHDCVDIPNFQRPHVTSQEKLQHLSDKSVPLCQVPLRDDNLLMFDQGNRLTYYGPPYAGTPKLLSAVNKGCNPCINPQLHGSVSRASNSSAKFIDYFENNSHGVAEMSSMANMRQISQSASKGFTLSESAKLRFPSPAENMSGDAMHYPPCSDLSGMELRSSLCPFPEWKQRAVSFRQNCMSEEFFGLPLNSQGELIQASSNGKGCFNQLNKSNMEAGSSRALPVLNYELQRNTGDCSSSLKERYFVERFLPKDQLSLFGENYVKENPNLHLPARLGVSESPITAEEVHRRIFRNGSSHTIPLLDSGQNLMNISFDRFRQYDQVQNQDGVGVVHPKETRDQMLLNTTQLTMRLMGKDVAIGRSSKEMQGFPDGKIWTDKEIISEHHTSSSSPENMSVKSHFQDWLNPVGKPNQPLEIQSNQAPQSNTVMRGPDSKFFHPYINWTNPVSEKGILSVNRNHTSKLQHIANPPPFHEMLNWTGNLEEPFTPGPDTLRVSSHAGSAPHINCQYVDWSPAEFKYKQNPPQATKSVFKFPFLHPDSGEPVQQSWFQSSCNSLVPWLLQTTQVTTPVAGSQSFAGFDGKYHPHTAEPNLPTTPCVDQSTVAYPYNSMTSKTHMHSSLGPVAVVHPSFVSALPGTQPVSSINMNYRNRNKAKDRMWSKALGIKSLNHCQKTKKRNASKDTYPTNATNISNLVIQEDVSAVTEFTREDYGRSTQCNAGASESNSNKNRASSSGCDPLEVQEDVYSIAGLARDNLIQDMQYNDGSLELNSDCVGASGVGCGPNESLKIGVRTSLGNDSPKVDGIARSGPIKLSAGAKHILKPSQNMDQDNSRMVHSTIPFATVPDSYNLSESQKKSTKFFRF